MTPGTKLGPLPAWAWGLVILGGLGLGLYLRRHSSSSPTASLVSAGGPVASLGSGGGGSIGDGTGGTSTGMDPLLAQLLADSSSALVNESGVFAGLAAQSVQGALDAANGALSLGATVAQTPPVIYTIGASAAGSSPAGTTSLTSTPTTPVPSAPYSAPAPVAAPAPVITAAQTVSHEEWLAHQAALKAPGATYTAGF